MNALWKNAPEGVLTTGIGSLPHPYVDAALQFSFRMKVPFLPQLPMRNSSEFMIAQAIDGLPGLKADADGMVKLDLAAWKAGSEALRTRTDAAFKVADSNKEAFDEFLPTPEVWSSWNPFLFELQERQVKFAKIHLAGPLTCQWSLVLEDGSPADRNPEIGIQVFRLALARCVAMARKLQSVGTTPLFFLDEPGFYGFTKANPRHLTGLQELKIFIQTLQKEGTLVGLHCCSNTDWPAILDLPLDVLSIDTQLSLDPLLTEHAEVKSFLKRGARLSLGIVPTGTHSVKIQSFKPELLVDRLMDSLAKHLVNEPDFLEQLLSTCLVTPACGLALHRIEDAHIILNHTAECAKLISERLAD